MTRCAGTFARTVRRVGTSPRRVVETPLLQEAEEQLNEYFAGAVRRVRPAAGGKGHHQHQKVWLRIVSGG